MDETTPGDPAGHARLGPQHRELLGQVLDKWSLEVLDRLCERPRRFNELRKTVPEITQKSLTTTLRRLERNGMVERVIVSTRPLGVEYRIAPLGKTLQDLIDALLEWSADNLPAVQQARQRFDAEFGAD
ncbi:MarR family transcriptional regulator [Saccharomonospora sp. CUA-673]|uniref:winged helix-turn-helix transcriptional regulator n=1 Tax=Saccharomonospora sp. CUA-673 TaxID=1904969 RepID=UPI00096867AB|nr:helix-turn-helix domain-containing protein [Saccharomonospora sp. CUA-673]OLT45237.1 MarR family transcriptional regulator [Saccharomonospora sp. CUA-673]